MPLAYLIAACAKQSHRFTLLAKGKPVIRRRVATSKSFENVTPFRPQRGTSWIRIGGQVPCGLEQTVLPMGIQFLAQVHNDVHVLDVARLYQHHTVWAGVQPPVD